MRVTFGILVLAVVVALGTSAAHAQTHHPDAEASALLDTAIAQLVELELQLLEVRSQGHEAPHPRVTGVTRQIAALRELLAEFPDAAEANAAARTHLVRALQARLASNVVAQRRMAARLDSSAPGVQALQRSEERLRTRLLELGVPAPQ